MIISPQRKSLDHLLVSTDVVGNTVLSDQGRYAGTVDGFYFEDGEVKGLRLIYDRDEYFLDVQYVKSYDEEAVMLTTQPYYLLRGLKVYDDDGRYLGTVRDVTRKPKTNKVEEIVVRRFFFTTPLSIPAEDIKTANENIILGASYDND